MDDQRTDREGGGSGMRLRVSLRFVLLVIALAAVCLATFGQIYRNDIALMRRASEMQRASKRAARAAAEANNRPSLNSSLQQ